MMLLLAIVAAAACTEEEPALPRLDAEFAGCAEVHRGPKCLLAEDDRTLVIWAALPESTRLRVRSSDEVLPVSQRYVEGGVQIRVDVPREAEALVVETFEGGEATRAFRLALGEAMNPAALTRASELRASGHFEEAEAAARPLLEGDDPGMRTRARSFLGRLALSRGDTERAVELLGQASDELYAQGVVSGATNDAIAQAHTLAWEHWDFTAAEAALERAHARSVGFDEGFARVPYYRGMLHLQLGDRRNALSFGEEAHRRAARLEMERLRGLAVQLQAAVLQSLGRYSEAATRLESMRDAVLGSDESCERANFLINVGWARLLEAEGAAGSSRLRTRGPPDPREPLQAALREYQSSCHRSSDLGNVELNLALAALHRSDLDRARHHLSRARGHVPARSATVTAWTAEVEARILKRDGRLDDALASYAALIARADAAGSLDVEWRARLGRARVLVAADRKDQAVTELERAEDVLDELTLRIALGDGRDSFSGDRDGTARLLIDLLLDRDPERAARAARRARRRALQSLQRTERLAHLDPHARERWAAAVGAYWRARTESDRRAASAWELPAEELARFSEDEAAFRARLSGLLDAAFDVLGAVEPDEDTIPRDGEVWLLFHPTVAGWAAFAITAAGVRSARVALPHDTSPQTAGDSLLMPFRDLIASAAQVRILAYGPLESLDFALLSWNDGVLIDALPVTHGLDIGSVPRVGMRPTRALVIADPRGDLPAARAEAQDVTELLRARGQRVDVLVGDAVRPDRLRAALRHTTLLHFAGHGLHAGRGSWESVLPLAGESELTLGDVLALPDVPDEVVLSACEAGRADDARSGTPGMSLARAFVAAGATAVIAAVRPVPDEVAARFATAYHEARAEHSPAEAHRAAVLALRESDPEHVSTYRMFVP